MNITDTMPFARELLAPTYAESFRRVDAGPRAGDVAVEAAWGIAREGEDAVVAAAAEHLERFFALSLGAPLAGAPGGPHIRLRVDPGVGESPEAHRLRVTPAGIEVAGAGPTGVLQGVFRLEARLRERGGPFLSAGEEQRAPLFRHRIHRSPLSPFYVEELTGYDGPPLDARWLSPGMAYPAYREEDAGPETFYHDGILMRLAEHGFNAIWVRAALRLFARCDPFPEWGADSHRILERLDALCARAARWGLRVFLYMQEPMGMRADDPFWQRHPQVMGSHSRYQPMVHLCTSTPEVKAYLRDGTRYVFSRVPALAGVALITASEFPSHCYTSTQRPDDAAAQQKLLEEKRLCPRCLPRMPREVIGEIVGLIGEGAKAANPAAEVIAWNWSWSAYEPDPQRGVLECLPADTIVMGDFERGQPAEACGFAYTNDEYNIKVVGPSRRFQGVADFLRERGRPVYARIQIGTTHENPDIPYLPVPQKLGEKYHALRESGVTGMMTCWNFGNMPSLGTEVTGEFTWSPQPDVAEGVRRVAARRFGEAAADDVVAAWEILSRAHDDFPGSIPVMYRGPISRGPVLPFPFDPVNRPFANSWLLEEEIEGDRLDWAAPFGPEKVAECFRSEVAKAAAALPLFERALAKTEGEDRRRLAREVGVAKFHLIQTTSGADLVEFILARNAYYSVRSSRLKPAQAGHCEHAEARAHLERMEALCRAEVENARAALPLLEADSRLGWHGEAYGYMVDRPLVEKKLAGLEEILTRRIPAERGRLEG